MYPSSHCPSLRLLPPALNIITIYRATTAQNTHIKHTITQSKTIHIIFNKHHNVDTPPLSLHLLPTHRKKRLDDEPEQERVEDSRQQDPLSETPSQYR